MAGSKSYIIILYYFVFLCQIQLSASTLTEISPVTDKILALHFTDGYVEHHELGQSGDNDVVYKNTLEIYRAGNRYTYLLTSENDENYITGKNPVLVGRKSKGSDFSRKWPPIQPFVSDHWIYLELPHALKQGADYTLNTGSLDELNNTHLFTFNEFTLRSETVHVNQLGFVPAARKKYAYLSHWMGSLGPLSLDDYNQTPFHVYDFQNNKIVFSGKIKLRKDLETGSAETGQIAGPNSNFTAADVWECDFSTFSKPGLYKIVVEKIGCSFPFKIDADIYREAFYASIRGLYHQRCGIALEEPFTKWTKLRCHHPAEHDSVIVSTWRFMDGGNAFTQLPAGKTDEKRYYWGGWHDAGDWDRHHWHLNVCSSLLLVFEYAQDHFNDGELNIPESGNGIPDIIDEARWCIDFFKRMQEPDGGVHGGIETFRHPAEGVSSVTDTDQWYAYAADPEASFHYAAVACQLAYCLRLIGQSVESEEYIISAQKAYDWAEINLREGDEQKIRDLRMFAAAALFKVTGDAKFQRQFKADNLIITPYTPLSLWESHDQQWAVWTFITTDLPNIDLSLKSNLKEATKYWAKIYNIENANKRSYRIGGDWWQPVMVSHATTPKNMPLIAAYYISGKKEYLDYQYTACDYYLGGNPLNMCWLTGTGDRSPKEIMHLDSWFYHKNYGMIPGIVPYGPYRWESFTTGDFNGPWDFRFGLNTTYPDASLWPVHELWFENRYCPITNEYTVHESQGPAAAAYGFLTAKLIGNSNSGSVRESNQFIKVYNNFPNPFNKSTQFSFDILKSTLVTITIFDVLGRTVQQIFHQSLDSGYHEISWNGVDSHGITVSSGVYFFRIETEGQSLSLKILYLRN